MRLIVGVVAMFLVSSVSSGNAGAACGDQATDASAVAAVESTVSAQCDCCASPHLYAACVTSLLRTSLRGKQLSGSCALKVRRDVAHVCPRPTAAACQPCNADSDCGPGAFCECRGASCTKTGGVCRPQPQVCPDIVAPVCGCDGTTYANDCLRQQAGACRLHAGACFASGGCFDTIEHQCTGASCSPAAGCRLPNEFCSPTCGTTPPTGTCFDLTTRKCTALSCGPDQPCLPNQFCETTCPPPPPNGHCFVTVDRQCSTEPCGPGMPCQNPNEVCDPQCPPPECTTDADCNDGNACTADSCVNGSCQHACVCLTPAGGAACCPGPDSLCLTPCGTSADGTCGGVCPAADEVCTATGDTCACMPKTPPACGDSSPACNGTCPTGSTCQSPTGAPSCQCVPGCTTDTDCDDGNGCTVDHCVDGTCEHACICLTPAGGPACCAGPGTACVEPCGMDQAGTCGGTCPSGGTCEALASNSATGACGCVSGVGGPCGGFILPRTVCAPGLVCRQSNPDVMGVCVAPTCLPFGAQGCAQTAVCCQPCGNGVIAPCAVCIGGACLATP